MTNKWTGKLSATEIFSKSLNILSINIIDIVKISLIFYIIPSILTIVICAFLGVTSISFNTISNFSNDIDYLFSHFSILLFFLWIPITIILSLIPIWGNFSIVKLINARLKNEKITWYECIKYSFSKTGSALLLIVITLIISIIWIFTTILFITILSFFTFFIGLSIAIIAVIALTITIFIYLQFIIQSIVSENLGVFSAIKYSINLVKVRFWNALGKITLLKLVCFLFNAGLTIFAIIPFIGIILSTLITLCLTIFEHTTITIIFNDYEKNPNKLEFTL